MSEPSARGSQFLLPVYSIVVGLHNSCVFFLVSFWRQFSKLSSFFLFFFQQKMAPGGHRCAGHEDHSQTRWWWATWQRRKPIGLLLLSGLLACLLVVSSLVSCWCCWWCCWCCLLVFECNIFKQPLTMALCFIFSAYASFRVPDTADLFW